MESWSWISVEMNYFQLALSTHILKISKIFKLSVKWVIYHENSSLGYIFFWQSMVSEKNFVSLRYEIFKLTKTVGVSLLDDFEFFIRKINEWMRNFYSYFISTRTVSLHKLYRLEHFRHFIIKSGTGYSDAWNSFLFVVSTRIGKSNTACNLPTSYLTNSYL